MLNHHILKGLFFLLFNLFGFLVSAQLSKTHYIPPLTDSGTNSSAPQDHYIYISTPKAASFSFTIKPVGLGAASHITGTVSNATPYIYTVGNGRDTQLYVNVNETSTVKTNKGFIIEAQDVIYVSVRVNAGAQAGALVSKGLAALGTTYRVGSYTNANPQDNYLNFVSVMATEDNTQVSFSDLPAGIIIENYLGTAPVNTTLNKGESYTLATNSSNSVINRDGLIGCLVSSDKPIVVNCGSANGSFHNGTGRDFGIDQIVDLSKVGTEYIFVKGDGQDGWENVLIVAHTNNTAISINGNTPIATINAGDYYLIEGNQYSPTGNMYVETSQPVFAYQGIGATNSEANQGMFFVPPLSCETRGNLDNIANIESIGGTSYTGGISIVTKVGATVTINNLPISNFSAIGPNNVTGNPNYVTYKVTGLTGNISVQSTDELYCAYFNFNGAATSGSFYSGFPSPPEINFNALFSTLGVCIPNVTLEVANVGSFDGFEWFFNDGSGFVTTGNTSLQFTPTQSGTYKLIGTLNCTNTTLESLEVPVSICPDDVDNDGIPDNIDIDNDNDGILNCTESNGNQAIDLSNPTSGTIPVGSYTYTGTINPIGNTSITPLIGTPDGTFMSETPSRNNTSEVSVTYDLIFNKNVNLLFEYANSTTLGNGLLTNDEEFIIRVPNTKTITLLDPDDQLLVDTNFDGIYETGITQISAFEIRFKLKATSLAIGVGTFSFSANSVDSFTYIHKNNSDTNTNQATFKLTATCVAKDTDLDGIEDALDLDSDNDGIPDFIENSGTLVALSGIDADFNGLDDIYSITTTPIDSDGDGVPDFYDLDSDNDGIYDVFESGSGLLDNDFDGVIDNVLATIGVNGWDDNAETSPDSNMIGYTVNDLDTDSIFSYRDLDSDGDTCSDVIEAGFSDGNMDDLLGDNNVTVDASGLVTNASDGYTLPNAPYLIDGTIIITTQPINTITCVNSDTTIFMDSSPTNTIQWEVSTDNGVNWTPIVDNSVYNGSLTNNLNIINTPLSLNTYQYRAFINNTNNLCGLYSNEIILTVNPLPIANTPSIYTQCDDASNDGQALFNLELSTIKEEINPNYMVEGLTFTFYEDQTEAENKGIAIVNPSNYQDALGFSTETVWIRVENLNGCFRVVPLNLEVSPSSAALSTYNPNPIHQCDDGLDTRDGIAVFDLTNIQNYISTTVFSTFDVSVHFYESQLDAELEINEILDPSNHQNTNSPNMQDIWVRTKSDLGNSCLGLERFPNLLVVEPLPVANPLTISRQCDMDTSDSILTYPFDTSQIETDLFNGQNPANVTVTYFDNMGNALPSPLPNPFMTQSQIITIRVTNNTTSDPDGACYDETTLEFIVDQQPIANSVPAFEVCDGAAGDVDDDGLYEFNTSTIQSTILDAQIGMEIYYTYINELGTAITRQTLPNPFNSGNQTVFVEVINPINPTCSATTSIDFIVNPLPDFNIETPQIVCSSDPNFTIVLDPIEVSPTENFNYSWVLNGTEISTNPTLTVSEPGTYTITLSKTDGTGCSRSKNVFVNASELAIITQEDVTINDITDNNTVTINNPTTLGLGNYWFSLESIDGQIFYPYQNEPIFTNVKAGFYNLFVQDKDGCGTTSLPISIIGYPKFFTPNNDGYNDLWQIQGINALVQPNSSIYIFDRYGKLLKQLSPASPGWDGTFNGSTLSSDDYWFKVLLQDGRTFMGHFALKR